MSHEGGGAATAAKAQSGASSSSAMAVHSPSGAMASSSAEPSSPGEDTTDPKQSTNYHPWTPQEDDTLRELVGKYGAQNWSEIAKHLPGRNGKSCRLRWVNQLRGDIRTDAFSAEEDKILLEAHQKYGNKWTQIAKLLPGRTDNAVKNRYHSTLKRQVEKQEKAAREQQQQQHLAVLLGAPSTSMAAAGVSTAGGVVPLAAGMPGVMAGLPMQMPAGFAASAAAVGAGGLLGAPMGVLQVPYSSAQLAMAGDPSLLLPGSTAAAAVAGAPPWPAAAQQQQQQQLAQPPAASKERQDERERQLIAALYSKGHIAMAIQLHNLFEVNAQEPPDVRQQLMVAALQMAGYQELATHLQEQYLRDALQAAAERLAAAGGGQIAAGAAAPQVGGQFAVPAAVVPPGASAAPQDSSLLALPSGSMFMPSLPAASGSPVGAGGGGAVLPLFTSPMQQPAASAPLEISPTAAAAAGGIPASALDSYLQRQMAAAAPQAAAAQGIAQLMGQQQPQQPQQPRRQAPAAGSFSDLYLPSLPASGLWSDLLPPVPGLHTSSAPAAPSSSLHPGSNPDEELQGEAWEAEPQQRVSSSDGSPTQGSSKRQRSMPPPSSVAPSSLPLPPSNLGALLPSSFNVMGSLPALPGSTGGLPGSFLLGSMGGGGSWSQLLGGVGSQPGSTLSLSEFFKLGQDNPTQQQQQGAAVSEAGDPAGVPPSAADSGPTVAVKQEQMEGSGA